MDMTEAQAGDFLLSSWDMKPLESVKRSVTQYQDFSLETVSHSIRLSSAASAISVFGAKSIFVMNAK